MKTYKKQSVTCFNALCLIFTLLLVGCGDDDSGPTNTIPFAKAVSDSEATLGDLVKLDAGTSSDPDGGTLSYNWSFVSKPQTSTASIIGASSQVAEFTLDKAGVYQVLLSVSNGRNTATDSLTITNRTPIISVVDHGRYFNLGLNFIKRGGDIAIMGDFFSLDKSENNVTIGGKTCEIVSLTKTEMTVEVADSASSGDLVITVGAQQAVFPDAINIIDEPVFDVIYINDQLELRRRKDFGSGSFEIGTRFKPMVNGKVMGMRNHHPNFGDQRVTLWDVEAKVELVSETIKDRSKLLDVPVTLEQGKEYMITFNAEDWYFFLDPQDSQGNIYPMTHPNFEVTGQGFHTGSDLEFPDVFPVNYVTLGGDVIFVEDIE